jgi:phosphoribosyl-dephospho-CoA transferase
MDVAAGTLAHDLLRLAPDAVLVDVGGRRQSAPAWVERAVARTRWVVVRRDVRGAGRVPVGIRGDVRRLRHGAWVHGASIVDLVTPEEVGRRALTHPVEGRWAPVLCDVATAIGDCDIGWGPVGSVGFELMTETSTTGAASDLDLLLRAGSPLPDRGRRLAVRLQAVGRRHGCRMDCLVETPLGGVHLGDLSAGGTVLLRTDRGAVLVEDPWPAR